MTAERGQEDVFLADVAEHPDDDAPRLNYADWLDDHGDPSRAEFIRIQCELARLGEDDPHRRELADRSAAIQEAHEAKWLRPLRQALDRPGREQVDICTFERGFIRSLYLRARRTDVLAAAADFLRRWAVQDAFLCARPRFSSDDFLSRSLRCPELATLRKLDLYGRGAPVTPEVVRRLARSPHLPRLTGLQLPVTKESAEALLSSSLLPRLTWLGMKADDEVIEVARRVANSEHVGDLMGLDLGWYMKDEGLRLLLDGPHLRRLEDLDIDLNRIDDAGIAALARSPLLVQLRRLNLCLNLFGIRGVQALANSPRLAGLRELNLSHNERGGRFAPTLAASPHLAGLRRLDLEYTETTDAGAAALAESPHLGNLEKLDLSGNSIGDEGAAALAASSHLGRLRDLDLYACEEISDQGALVLLHAPQLSGLRHLWLSTEKLSRRVVTELRERFGGFYETE